MKILFLDDSTERRTSFRDNCQDHTIVMAKDYLSAVQMFNTNDPFDIMFLDHDLGQKQTGLDVIKYMVSIAPDKIAKLTIVHSSNTVGGPNMIYLLRDFGKRAYWNMFIPSRRWVNEQLAILNANP